MTWHSNASGSRNRRRCVCFVVIIVVVFVGPATSGALLLLLPALQRSAPHGLPENYTPAHKGHVSLDIGLYFRENEDLVVPGTPGLVLRRSYASSYRTPREFGVRTTHAAEWFVIGDGKQFQWAELVRPGPVRHSSLVVPGREQWLKRDLVQTYLFVDQAAVAHDMMKSASRGSATPVRFERHFEAGLVDD